MPRLFLFPALLLVLSGLLASAEDHDNVSMNDGHRALFKSHCTKCHDADKQKGKVRLDDLSFNITDIETAERWQKILNALNSGEMPPEDEDPLPNDAKTELLDDLANTMVAARKLLADQKGAITMRRLNRREYKNTLRDLLGVEINVNDLPSDSSSGNYDTVGSNLFMSANQFEQYLSLGKQAIKEAFAWELAIEEERLWHYEAEEISEKVAKYVEWQIDAKARAEKWVKEVEAAAARPENAKIVAKLREEVDNHESNFRRLWKQIPGAPSPESFGFETKENNADKANSALRAYWLPYHQYYLQQPAIDTGMYFAIPTEHPSKLENGAITFLLPWSYPSGVKWPAGNYVVRFRAAVTGGGTSERRFIEFGVNPRGNQAMSVHEITGTMDAPQTIEIPFSFTSAEAERADRTLYLREKGTHDHYLQTRRLVNEGKSENGIGRTHALWVDWVEVERVTDLDRAKPLGIAALDLPFDEASKGPGPSIEMVRGSFERFSKEAFRGREASPKFVDGLVKKYETRLGAGDAPAAALKETLAVVLSSPMFLYLAEPSVKSKPRPLTDQELATRLSYFLWGSPPDVELRKLAANGELAKPEVFAAQTTRLLDDPRSRGFSDAFTYQWLGLDRLDFFRVNLEHHPRFDNSTKLAARNEIYETMAYLLRENQSVSNLLRSDYAIINGVLAEYYELRGVTGDQFRRVTLPKDSPRGGLLGMAAVNLMGGNGEETSPVERGAWVLRKLLNDPPPPAPANIPQIARLAGQVLTTQERLQAHQEEAQCASCHRRIDPIGMGLENFDAVGAWRNEDTFVVKDDKGKPVKDKQKTWTIDPAGKLHNGPEFKDYYELRDILVSREDDFARGIAEGLIEYALGRPVGFSDEDLVAAVVSKAKKKDFAIREFIHATVGSKEFHQK